MILGPLSGSHVRKSAFSGPRHRRGARWRCTALAGALAGILALGACAQPYGVTTASFEAGDVKIGISDGKERDRVRLVVTGPDGWSAEYEASDVTAFEGQRIAAALQSELAARGVEGAGEIAGAVVRAVLGTGALEAGAGVLGGALAPVPTGP